jgi:hypothetical protein
VTPRPNVQNRASLTEFMEEKRIDASNVVTLTYPGYRSILKPLQHVLPEVLIFNRDGEFLSCGAEAGCNADAIEFIRDLDSGQSYDSPDKILLDSAAKALRDLDRRSFSLQSSDDIDFHALIYWAKWNGKRLEDQVLVWESAALSNQQARIKVLKVNVNWQEHWGEETLAWLGGEK